MGKPQSESALVWSFLKFILTVPITLFQVIFQKKSFFEFLKPVKDLVNFVLEPKATIALIILNLAAFLLEVFYLSRDQLEQYVFSPEHLFTLNFPPIVASWFLHASIAHLLGNMLFLFIFGRVVERNIGSLGMLLIYFFSAICSTIASAFFHLGGIGASGAIAGIISAAVLLEPLYLTYMIIGIPLPIVFVAFLAMLADVSKILLPVHMDNVNHIAHLAGYLAVIPIMFLMKGDLKQKMVRNLFISLGLIAIFFFLHYVLKVI